MESEKIKKKSITFNLFFFPSKNVIFPFGRGAHSRSLGCSNFFKSHNGCWFTDRFES